MDVKYSEIFTAQALHLKLGIQICISFPKNICIFAWRDFPNTHATRWQTDSELKQKQQLNRRELKLRTEHWAPSTEYWILKTTRQLNQ